VAFEVARDAFEEYRKEHSAQASPDDIRPQAEVVAAQVVPRQPEKVKKSWAVTRANLD
jgi:hypothetical protein